MKINKMTLTSILLISQLLHAETTSQNDHFIKNSLIISSTESRLEEMRSLFNNNEVYYAVDVYRVVQTIRNQQPDNLQIEKIFNSAALMLYSEIPYLLLDHFFESGGPLGSFESEEKMFLTTKSFLLEQHSIKESAETTKALFKIYSYELMELTAYGPEDKYKNPTDISGVQEILDILKSYGLDREYEKLVSFLDESWHSGVHRTRLFDDIFE